MESNLQKFDLHNSNVLTKANLQKHNTLLKSYL